MEKVDNVLNETLFLDNDLKYICMNLVDMINKDPNNESLKAMLNDLLNVRRKLMTTHVNIAETFTNMEKRASYKQIAKTELDRVNGECINIYNSINNELEQNVSEASKKFM